jgi:hypothetical protein
VAAETKALQWRTLTQPDGGKKEWFVAAAVEVLLPARRRHRHVDLVGDTKYW